MKKFTVFTFDNKEFIEKVYETAKTIRAELTMYGICFDNGAVYSTYTCHDGSKHHLSDLEDNPIMNNLCSNLGGKFVGVVCTDGDQEFPDGDVAVFVEM